MRSNGKATKSPAVVAQMAEEEDDGIDEGYKPTSPTGAMGSGAVKIVLNDGVLKAGSWLKGNVCTERGLPQISNVSVTVKGVGLAQFASDDGKEYKAKKVFLSEAIDLGGDLEQRVSTANDSNELALPFQYRLPPDAPPSFVGNYGAINYECAAVVKFVSPLARRRIGKARFQVLPKRGNNGSIPSTPTMEASSKVTPSPSLANTVFYTHRMSSFGFSDGTVDFHLRTDETNVKRGRTPIKVALEVTNKTNLHLRDLRFGVMLSVEWNAKGRRVTERKMIAEERKDEFCLRPSEEVRLEKEFPPIPADLPPTVEFSENGSGTSPPVCRCTYMVFAKLIPPNFAKTCLVQILLNVY